MRTISAPTGIWTTDCASCTRSRLPLHTAASAPLPPSDSTKEA